MTEDGTRGDTSSETERSPEAPTPRPAPSLVGGTVLREVLVVYGAAFLGTMALGAVDTGSALDDVAQVGIALLFLGLPLWIARREPHGARRFGIDLSGVLEPEDDESLPSALRRALPSALRELGVALLLALVIFPPFVVGFALWYGPTRAFGLALAPDFASFAIAQFVLVGLPEEAFFRGYAQTRLHDFGRARGGALWTPRRILGADLAIAPWILSAILFALVHLASEPRLDELATFFPGLVFSWLRARRGGIGAAICFHALSNILAEILVGGWLR